MTGILVRRLIRVAVVCVGVSLVTFGILQLSGDPVALMMPEAPEADRAKLRETMGFNDPLPVQFARFLARSVRGEFGNSFYHRSPAFELVVERMPTTLALTLVALGLAVAVSVPAGIYSAVRRDSLVDHAVTVVVFLGQSMPVFWTGIMLMLLFAVQLKLVPVSGWDGWQYMVLPAITLGAFQAPLLVRIVRSSMLEVLSLDYVRTARSKGVSEWAVICRHALVNAALPLVTVTGLQLGILLSGAVITETVFAVPGVGRLLLRAIVQLDFPVVQASVFLLAMIVVAVNFAVDMLYVYLNPQIRMR